MARHIAIALLRNDLRVSDNPILYAARDAPKTTHLLPLFVFDERQIELSGVAGFKEAQRPEDEPLSAARTRICGFWRTGRHRARFLVQSVFDLKSQLKSLGSDLGIYMGRPENIVPQLVHQLLDQGDTIEGVWLQQESASEEVSVERRLLRALKELQTPLHLDPGARTLVHGFDLPFKILSQLPDVFTAFRKRVEGLNQKMVRPVLPVPSKGHWKPFPLLGDHTRDSLATTIFALPSDMTEELLIEQLTAPLVAEPVPGDTSHNIAYDEVPGTAFPFKGGESPARQRLDYYFGVDSTGENCPAVTYKETRNGLLGADYSTKFSPYLTFGCLSAREIAARCDDLEDRLRVAGKLTDSERKNVYWIKFELLWRDYMFFVNIKYGNNLFKPQGLMKVSPGDTKTRSDWTQWDSRNDKLQAWFEGRTGVPFVDACMRELTSTGYMSNRGRQNVASYLTKDLYFDWRIGAEFFESFLLDYDPASNYGNWAYVAGVGNDPREERKFNVIKQAKDYDPDGEYVKQWVPEVSGSELSGFQRHIPWRVWSGAEQKNSRIRSYPRSPVVEDSSWKKFYSDGDRKHGKHGKGGRGVERGPNGHTSLGDAGQRGNRRVQYGGPYRSTSTIQDRHNP
ncbi:hypothetical protein OPQ81_005688 [Rhizoctonia solani]|nr:hypothetical protein OPQ81_005688 [Rhizoctonia solani]